MKIDIRPNLDQIRFYAKSALHAFDHVSLEEGRTAVQADMLGLLAYLEAFDDGVGIAVAGIGNIEGGIRIEVSTREGETFEVGHSYAHARVLVEANKLQDTAGIVIENIGPENRDGPDDPKADLRSLSDRGDQE